MNQYFLIAKDGQGKEIELRYEADSVETAIAQCEKDGFTEPRLHDMEPEPEVNIDEPLPEVEIPEKSAGMANNFEHPRFFRPELRKATVLLFMLAIIMTWFFGVLVGFAPILLWFVILGLFLKIYRMEKAFYVLRQLQFYGHWQPMLDLAERFALKEKRPELRFFYDYYRAAALAGMDRYDEGMEIWAGYEHNPQIHRSSFLEKQAVILGIAGKSEEALGVIREARALDPDNEVTQLALAQEVMYKKGDTAEAKRILSIVEQNTLLYPTETVLEQVRGMIAVEEGRYADALGHLQTALEGFPKIGNTPEITGMRILTEVYAVFSRIQLGDREHTKERLSEIYDFLKVHRSAPRTKEICEQGLSQAD